MQWPHVVSCYSLLLLLQSTKTTWMTHSFLCESRGCHLKDSAQESFNLARSMKNPDQRWPPINIAKTYFLRNFLPSVLRTALNKHPLLEKLVSLTYQEVKHSGSEVLFNQSVIHSFLWYCLAKCMINWWNNHTCFVYYGLILSIKHMLPLTRFSTQTLTLYETLVNCCWKIHCVIRSIN